MAPETVSVLHLTKDITVTFSDGACCDSMHCALVDPKDLEPTVSNGLKGVCYPLPW